MDIDNKNKFIYAGCISTLFSSVIFYPLDTIKSRMQINSSFKLNSLYKGCKYELLAGIPGSIIYWGIYQTCRNKNISIEQSSLLSAIGSSIYETPLDCIKRKQQVFLGKNKVKIIRYGFATVIQSILYNMIYMKTLEMCKKKDINKSIGIVSSCSISSIFTYWLDVIKSKCITPQFRNSYKPFLQFILYKNLYSGLYMHLFLYLTENTI